MIDQSHDTTPSVEKIAPAGLLIQSSQAKTVKGAAEQLPLSQTTLDYIITPDLIRVFFKPTENTASQNNNTTELIFPRKELTNFHFSKQQTVLEYNRPKMPRFIITISPHNRTITGVLKQKEKTEQQPMLSFSYALQKSGRLLFTKLIDKGWAIALSAMPEEIEKEQTIAQSAPIASKAQEVKASFHISPNLIPLEKNDKAENLATPATETAPITAPSRTAKEFKKMRNTKISLFQPGKLLNRQLLKTPLTKLNALTNPDTIFDYYLTAKKAKILEKITPRIKPGTTLSLLYPDYRNYAVVQKNSIYTERTIEPGRVQSGYYIWQENNKIITSPSTKLMPLRVAENLLQKHLVSSSSSAIGGYIKQLDETYKTATKQPFALNSRSLSRLRRLLKRARQELLKNHSNTALSSAEYGRTLTILRSWVTYDYLKRLSVQEFQDYYRRVERTQGRGRYTHIKITQLLGLQDTGRILSNRNFLNQYHYAIEKAAQKYPTIPLEWINHIIWIETKGDPRAISHAGAYGVMQLLPDVFIGKGEERARYYNLSFVDTINPFNVEQSIDRGTAFLAKLLAYLNPVIRSYPLKTRKQILFHAYNRGPTKVKQLVKSYGLGYVKHLPRETRLYLDRLGDYPL